MFLTSIRLFFLFMVCLAKVNLLSVVCRNGSKEKYVGLCQQIANTCREMREEVVSMEIDILVGESMAEFLDKTKVQMESNLKELQAAAIMASLSSTSAETSNPRLLSLALRIKDSSSKMVKCKIIGHDLSKLLSYYCKITILVSVVAGGRCFEESVRAQEGTGGSRED